MNLSVDNSILFAIKLSLKISTLSTILVGTIGTPIAYLFSRKDFPLKWLLETIFLLPLVFAPTVTGYLLLMILKKSILFTWKAALVASSIAAFPLFFKTAQAAFSEVDQEYIAVSYTLGRGPIYTFVKVVLPLARKGLTAALVLSFARAMGEFGATLMVAGNIPFKTTTIPLEIYNAVFSAEFQRANLLVLFAALISCLVVLIANSLSKDAKSKNS